MPGPATRCASRTRAPFVATVHATELGRHQGHLTSTTSEAINASEWWLTYEAQRVICCSGFMVEEVVRSFQLPRDKITMVPNGVDPSRFRTTGVTRAGADAPLIVSWGRLEYEKGFQTLIAAVARLVPRWPALRCVLVGRGTYSEELRGVARGLGVEQSVQFAGFVSDEELVRLLNEATCAVIPSLYEPFGIVALEALSAGAPLIAAESGGLREVLTGTDAGLVFPPGNADALGGRVRAHAQRAGAHREVPSRRHGAGRVEVLVGRDRGFDPRGVRRRGCPTQEEVQAKGRQGEVVKALRSFTVRARLPEPLAPLETLALNLRWSWDQETRDLFRWVDPDLWEATRRDPVAVIATVDPRRLQALTEDPGFMRFLSDTADELSRYLTNDRWFQLKGSSSLQLVGYFSPEFGISEALPQYSGGLGVLAGDHLKAASDLGVPLVGVGLFYRHGYFRQSLSHDGWQQERYPDLDPYAMALTLCDGLRVSVDLAGRTLHAQVWRADVGRTPLYLLDADIDDNDPDMREVTDRLYGGDVEHRLQQEILLGMGGVRMLDALGLDVQVFHTNEGHAGFLGLERMHRLITKEGLSFAEAVEAVRASSLFTTHTPVPAGIDRFPKQLMEQYFGTWATDCGISIDELLALGHRSDETDDRFNMAVMGLRLAARSNAVAKLHGEVSRHMFAGLWPDVPVAETPITSITNGVHAPTWTAPEFADVFTRYVSPGWTEALVRRVGAHQRRQRRRALARA